MIAVVAQCRQDMASGSDGHSLLEEVRSKLFSPVPPSLGAAAGQGTFPAEPQTWARKRNAAAWTLRPPGLTVLGGRLQLAPKSKATTGLVLSMLSSEEMEDLS